MVKRFLLLNGLAVIGLVLFHAAGWGFTALFWWTDADIPDVTTPNFDQIGSLSYYGLRTVEQLASFSIAAFLVVSGYFVAFSARQQSTVSWRMVWARIHYLLIPYLLWSSVLLVANYIQGAQYTWYRLIRILLIGGAADGYYYVPMLCQLYLLAPWLVRLARRNWMALLLASAIILIGLQIVLYLVAFGVAVPASLRFLTRAWLFPSNLFWFVSGIVIGFNLQPLKLWLGRAKRWLPGMAVVLLLLGILEWELIQAFSEQPFLPTRLTLLDNLYAAVVVLAILAFGEEVIPYDRQLSGLGGKSYGVYLANSAALELAARAIYVLLPWILAYQLLFQPILWAAGLGIPLAMMAIVSATKSPARKYSKYIFG